MKTHCDGARLEESDRLVSRLALLQQPQCVATHTAQALICHLSDLAQQQCQIVITLHLASSANVEAPAMQNYAAAGPVKALGGGGGGKEEHSCTPSSWTCRTNCACTEAAMQQSEPVLSVSSSWAFRIRMDAHLKHWHAL